MNDDANGNRAQQNTREPVGAWDGPFTVGKPEQLSINGTDFDVVDVQNSKGGTMATVWAHLCEGSDIPAMKARATRIAEALNGSQPRDYETSLTVPEAVTRAAHITEVLVGGRRFIPEPTN